MRKILVLSLALMLVCFYATLSYAQDWGVLPVIIDQEGTYTIDVDTVLVNYELAKTAQDSANVDSCLEHLSIIQLNADNIILDGKRNGYNAIIYSTGDPGDYNDVQAIWPNRNYGVQGLPEPLLENITIRNVQIEQSNKGIYLTKVRNATVENCTFKDCNQAIYPYSRVVPEASGCVIQNNTIIDCHDRIIYVRGPGHQILNNTIINNIAPLERGEGVRIERTRQHLTTDVLVKGNTFIGNSNLIIGIRVERSSGNTYEDNVISDVTQAGVVFDGYGQTDHSDANTFTNTTVTFAGANTAAGVDIIDLSYHNVFDNLTVDGANVAIVAGGGSKANVIKNSQLTNSITHDVQVKGNSNLFLINTEFDTSKVDVEAGSALFLGPGLTVNLNLTTVFDLDLEGTQVVVKNVHGDVVNTYTYNGEPLAIPLSLKGKTVSGYYLSNQFTFMATAPNNLYMGTLTTNVNYVDSEYTLVVDEFDWTPAVVVEAAGPYMINEDSIIVNYELAETAEDSAIVDSCIAHLAIIELNTNDIILDGNNAVIYGPGDPGDYYDVQAIWPNRNYNDGLLKNITIKNVTVENSNKGVYMTKVQNGIVENCTIKDCNQAIYPYSRAVPEASGCVVQNNTIIDCHDRILYVRGPGHQILNNTIINNTAPLERGEGVRIERTRQHFTSDILVKGNTFTGNSNLKIGIRVERSSGNTYEDNVITGVTDAGVVFDGFGPLDPSDANTFTDTKIDLVAADAAVGVQFIDLSSYNVFDTLMVNNADIAISVDAGSKCNVIQNFTITNSVTYDIQVKGNSSVILNNPEIPTFDPSKISVEKGSFIFLGEPIRVNLTALYMGLVPFTDATVVVTDANGDTVGTTLMTNAEDGTAKICFTLNAILASGLKQYQNPLTITAFKEVNDLLLTDEITQDITSSTSLTLIITDPKKTLVEAGEVAVPTEFALTQNYPNPFNPETHIAYQLPNACNVTLKIYNVTGQLIRTLVDEYQTPGYQIQIWNGMDDFGNGVSSGVYYYVMEAENFRDVKRMTFLK